MQAPPQVPPPPRKKTNVVLWTVLGVSGVVCCGGFIVVAAIMLPVFMQARYAAQSTRCMSSLKQMAVANTMYSIDYDGYAPPAGKWMDAIGPYGTEIRFNCPSARVEGKSYGYAFNKELSGKKLTGFEDPGNTPLAFDSTLEGRNQASGLETLPNPGRHHRRGDRGNNVAYTDASAHFRPTP